MDKWMEGRERKLFLCLKWDERTVCDRWDSSGVARRDSGLLDEGFGKREGWIVRVSAHIIVAQNRA